MSIAFLQNAIHEIENVDNTNNIANTLAPHPAKISATSEHSVDKNNSDAASTQTGEKYSQTVVPSKEAESDLTKRSPIEEEKKDSTTESSEGSDLFEPGVSIGLGDFIFYSLLVGLCAKGRDLRDFYSIVATLDAIIIGLLLTLIILATIKRALPALPISIALGMISAGTTINLGANLYNNFASEQIFV